MSFWSDLGRIQPGVFIRRNLGGAFSDAWGSVQTFVGQAAKEIKKNRVLQAVTAPQRIVFGAAASLIDPKRTQRILGLSEKELVYSQTLGQAAGVAGATILAPVAAPLVRQVLFAKPPPKPVAAIVNAAGQGGQVSISEIFTPPIFPENPADTVGELIRDWQAAGQPTNAPPPQAALSPAVTLAPPEPLLPSGPSWQEWALVAAVVALVIGLIVAVSRG